MKSDKAQETPAQVVARVRKRIKTEGLDAAVEALISVCRDPKAPAPAKATAATTLMRSGGMFDRKEDDLDGMEPHEMDGAQLARAVRAAMAK